MMSVPTTKTRERPPAVTTADLVGRFAEAGFINTTLAQIAETLVVRFEKTRFDNNPLTRFKADALIEIFDRQLKCGTVDAIFTLGMIEGLFDAQLRDFDIDAATEQTSQEIGALILRRAGVMRLPPLPDTPEKNDMIAQIKERVTLLSDLDPKLSHTAGRIAGMHWVKTTDDVFSAMQFALKEVDSNTVFINIKHAMSQDMRFSVHDSRCGGDSPEPAGLVAGDITASL